MTTPSKNLDSILPDELKGSSYQFVKDLFGVNLTLHSVSFSKDDRGVKATFTASKQGEKKQFYVTTRAIQAMKVGKHLLTNKLFPVDAKFITEGQAVLLADISTPWKPEVKEDTLDF